MFASEILTEKSGSLGLIIINRPQALNSLTTLMIVLINEALDEFERDETIATVVIKSAGDRAFCAGGDIRMLYNTGRENGKEALHFWREEYRLNSRIYRYSKPYISIADGITMGGGVGLTAHGRHRIVTERVRLAMPETAIGFFPDVGATWLLSRQFGELGTYAGLTGEILGAADSIALGLADCMVNSDQIDNLIADLSELTPEKGNQHLRKIIARHSSEPPHGKLKLNQSEIDRIFAGNSIEAIIELLQTSESEFAKEAFASLVSKSPTALKVTLELLRRGRRSQSLEECLNREYSAAFETIHQADFYEGVRAAVIDKDRQPKWKPEKLGDVAPDIIAKYFLPQTQLPFPSAEVKHG